MKAIFKNIGPIKEAELEMGDLTIIAGQNNTGKTYLVYTLYGFLQFCKYQPFIWKKIDFSGLIGEKTKEIAQQIEEKGIGYMELEKYKEIRNEFFNMVHELFCQEIIHQVFRVPKSKFEDAYFQLDFEESRQIMKGLSNSIPFSKGRYMDCSFKDENLVFETHIFENDDLENMTSPMIERAVYSLLKELIPNIYIDPHILSAERSGIPLFYKDLNFTRLVEELKDFSDSKKRRFNLHKFIEEQTDRYAKPIKDNIDFNRNLSYIQEQKSELSDDVISLIEKIVDGHYELIKDEIRFISTEEGNNKFDIPFHLASSSVRELSDLYFYLKHKERHMWKKLLIIDEPESHLSPTNQILMARLLVFCVNAGIKVLITTHSDYIIREVNNLIMLHGDFDKKQEFLEKHKKDYTENDHLNPESVRAYICEKGGLTKCNIDKRGIDGMTVFDDAIDRINQISAELVYMNMDHSKDD